MKLSCKHDIEAPHAFVFRQLADFDSWELAAMRRGADVSRTDKLRLAGPGMSWLARFAYRGKNRSMEVHLLRLDDPGNLTFSGNSSIADANVGIDLMELSSKRTRVQVDLDVKPKSLGAKLYVQSLRLTRSRVDRNFAQNVAQMAAEIEDRYGRQLRTW